MPWARAGIVLMMLATLGTVPSASAQSEDVREYSGEFTAPPGAEVLFNRARFVVSPVGLGADLQLRIIAADSGGNCGQYVVNTLQTPEPVDTTTSSPQNVDIAVSVTLSGAGNLCDDSPFTDQGAISLTLTPDEITGSLFFIQQTFDFRAPITAGGVTPPTTTATGGGGTGVTPGLEELLTGAQLSSASARAVSDLTQCASGIPRCEEAARAGQEFADEIRPHVNNASVVRALASAVILGSIRRPDGRLLVPSMGHVFPVLLRLGAQADTGDSEALAALLRLIGALTALSVGASS